MPSKSVISEHFPSSNTRLRPDPQVLISDVLSPAVFVLLQPRDTPNSSSRSRPRQRRGRSATTIWTTRTSATTSCLTTPPRTSVAARRERAGATTVKSTPVPSKEAVQQELYYLHKKNLVRIKWTKCSLWYQACGFCSVFTFDFRFWICFSLFFRWLQTAVPLWQWITTLAGFLHAKFWRWAAALYRYALPVFLKPPFAQTFTLAQKGGSFSFHLQQLLKARWAGPHVWLVTVVEGCPYRVLICLSLPTDADECKIFGQDICKNGQCSNLFATYTCYCRSGFFYNNIRLECVGKKSFFFLYFIPYYSTHQHNQIDWLFISLHTVFASRFQISPEIQYQSHTFKNVWSHSWAGLRYCANVLKCMNVSRAFRLRWVWIWKRLRERSVREHGRVLQLFLQPSVSPGQHTATLH